MYNNSIIYFFYINNIVFAFKNDQHNKIEKTVTLLSKMLIMERKEELK